MEKLERKSKTHQLFLVVEVEGDDGGWRKRVVSLRKSRAGLYTLTGLTFKLCSNFSKRNWPRKSVSFKKKNGASLLTIRIGAVAVQQYITCAPTPKGNSESILNSSRRKAYVISA